MQRYDRPRRMLGFAIAGLAGFVDATGFLAANSYFVSFMSGNTTRLGVDLITRPERAIVPVLLLTGFVAGVTLGALVADRLENWRKTMVLGLSTVLLALSVAVRSGGSETGFLALTVVAMGVLNNTFRSNGEVAVGVTYMTGALVRFGQGLAGRLSGHRRPGWIVNLLLWSSLAAGAVCGAAASVVEGWPAAGTAAAAGAVLTAAAFAIERRPRPFS